MGRSMTKAVTLSFFQGFESAVFDGFHFDKVNVMADIADCSDITQFLEKTAAGMFL